MERQRDRVSFMIKTPTELNRTKIIDSLYITVKTTLHPNMSLSLQQWLVSDKHSGMLCAVRQTRVRERLNLRLSATLNPSTAMLAVPSLGKRWIKVPDLKSLRFSPGKIQGDGRKFLDRFKLFWVKNITIIKWDPYLPITAKIYTKGEGFFLHILSLIVS